MGGGDGLAVLVAGIAALASVLHSVRRLRLPKRLCCPCGAVHLEFGSGPVLGSVDCGCEDCRARLSWTAAQAGGSPVPAPVLSFERGVRAIYLANSFKVLAGWDRLQFWRLREGGTQTMAVCSSCSAMVLSHAWYYQGNVVGASLDSVGYSGPPLPPQPMARVNYRSFPPDKIGPGAPVIYGDEPNVNDLLSECYNGWAFLGLPPVRIKDGICFGELLEISGGEESVQACLPLE